MRRVFLVVLALVFLASPLIADDGILNKLNDILEKFRSGYTELTTGLGALKTGQAELIAAQSELQTGQSQLSLGLIDLRLAQDTLTTGLIVLNEEQTVLNRELGNLESSFNDYVYATNEEFAALEAKNRRQKIGFIVGGGFLGGLAIISIYMGGK